MRTLHTGPCWKQHHRAGTSFTSGEKQVPFEGFKVSVFAVTIQGTAMPMSSFRQLSSWRECSPSSFLPVLTLWPSFCKIKAGHQHRDPIWMKITRHFSLAIFNPEVSGCCSLVCNQHNHTSWGNPREERGGLWMLWNKKSVCKGGLFHSAAQLTPLQNMHWWQEALVTASPLKCRYG